MKLIKVEATFDALLLTTGYRPRVNTFLKADSNVYNQEGTPLSSGRETSTSGLYFCGYYVSPTGGLRETGIEARLISASIAARKM